MKFISILIGIATLLLGGLAVGLVLLKGQPESDIQALQSESVSSALVTEDVSPPEVIEKDKFLPETIEDDFSTKAKGEATLVEKQVSPQESTPTKTHPTIFNEDKDIWGWYSERYIVLRWNPYNFSIFRVYKKTNTDNQWKLVSIDPLKRYEYFDSDLDKFQEVSYKVEAVTGKEVILKSYTPIFFQFNSKTGENHDRE